MQGSEVHFTAFLCVRHNARQWGEVCCMQVYLSYNTREGGAVCIMSVYQMLSKTVMCSVKHACVSDTMQDSEVQCAACVCVRYNARQ